MFNIHKYYEILGAVIATILALMLVAFIPLAAYTSHQKNSSIKDVRKECQESVKELLNA